MIRLPHPCFTPHPSKHTVPFLSPDTSTLHLQSSRERGKETARLLLLQLQPRRANTRHATCPAAKPTTTTGEGARPCPRAISRKGGVGREKAPPRFAFPRSTPARARLGGGLCFPPPSPFPNASCGPGVAPRVPPAARAGAGAGAPPPTRCFPRPGGSEFRKRPVCCALAESRPRAGTGDHRAEWRARPVSFARGRPRR